MPFRHFNSLGSGERYLAVVADGYGIGPPTSEGILALASVGLVTGSVLLVNSPYAEGAVRLWKQSGRPMELGWHPCLTMDRPLSRVRDIPSLVDSHGRFFPLSGFLGRLWRGMIPQAEIEIELEAQLARFEELTGIQPTLVSSHQHVQLFSPVGSALIKVLRKQSRSTYVRQVREPWQLLAKIPGARMKRSFLNLLGRRHGRQLMVAGFPSAQWLVGITNPSCVTDPQYLARWLHYVPGTRIELVCHPGYSDVTLIGRDCVGFGPELERRVHELHLLQRPAFREECSRGSWVLVAPSGLVRARPQQLARVA
jgi:predicted glycoside hydrolase/deacetylase ChbG (UPF0249 family)